MSKGEKMGIKIPRACVFSAKAKGICYREGARFCKQTSQAKLRNDCSLAGLRNDISGRPTLPKPVE